MTSRNWVDIKFIYAKLMPSLDLQNDVVVTKQTPRLGVSRYLGVLKTGTGNNCAIILTLHCTPLLIPALAHIGLCCRGLRLR